MAQVYFDKELFALQDEPYRRFNAKLIPNVPIERMIGVRTPALRALSRKLLKERPEETSAFLDDLPHRYFEEDNLHAFLLERIKDFDELLERTERFLPYVDNWATCDLFSPKLFRVHADHMIGHIRRWLDSSHCYTVRYAIGLLLSNYLDAGFDTKYLEWTAGVKSEEYYVKMMVAWYFSVALVKQYDTTYPYIERKALDLWTHNKAIQKACESRRIPPSRKEELRRLRS